MFQIVFDPSFLCLSRSFRKRLILPCQTALPLNPASGGHLRELRNNLLEAAKQTAQQKSPGNDPDDYLMLSLQLDHAFEVLFRVAGHPHRLVGVLHQ